MWQVLPYAPKSIFAAVLLASTVLGTATAELHSRVEMTNGTPTLLVDGQPHPATSYMTYVGIGDPVKPNPLLSKYTAQLAQAGCDIFTFVTDIGGVYGYTPTVWPEPDRFDFTYLDASAHAILDAAGPNAKLMLQLYIDAPMWWCEQHPEELLRLDNGRTGYDEKLFALPRADKFPSIASEVWRAAMKHAVETIIAHVRASDYGARILGYEVCGQKTEEWYHWSMNNPELGDYSAPMLRAWREWIKAKYPDDAALQNAWNQPGVARDTAVIPTQAGRYGDPKATFRDPVKEAHVIDFHRFWSDIMVDTIAYFAKVVKDATDHTKIVGGFYAYSFEFAELAEDAGHLALGRLLQCPDMDFIMSPGSYHRRNLKGGQSCFRAPVLSLILHKKLFWTDFDAASFKIHEKNMQELAPWLDALAATDTAEEFTWMMRRELGNSLAHGVNMVWFDLHGGYYDDPIILQDCARQREVRIEALQRDRKSNAEILVVFDEDSMHFLGFRNPFIRKLLIEQLAELPFVAPYDTVLLSDLPALDLRPYKLVIMANSFKLDAAQREMLQQRSADVNGIVWLYAPGYFAADQAPGSVENVAALTGIAVKRPDPEAPLPAAERFPLANGDSMDIPPLNADLFVADSISFGPPLHVATVSRGTSHHFWWNRGPVPAAWWRDCAKAGGVHLYHDNPRDQVYANANSLTLAAGQDAGLRTIHLRHAATVRDAFTGEAFGEGVREFTASFRSSEVRLFTLDPAAVPAD